MKLLTLYGSKPFRVMHVLIVQRNTASETSNYVYCVNSVRWLDLTVGDRIVTHPVILKHADDADNADDGN